MSVGHIVDYFATHGMSDDPEKVAREYVETFLADFTEVTSRYRADEVQVPATVLLLPVGRT